MIGRVNLADQVEATVIRSAEASGAVQVYTTWDVEHWRDGKLLSKTLDHNIVTNEGKNKLLNVMFGAAGDASNTQITTWYAELVSSYTTAVATMTYASPTYTPYTGYSGTRPAYVEIKSTAQTTNNSASKASFSITATGPDIIYGASLVGGGSAPTTAGDIAGGGTLFSYSLFAASKTVYSGDTLDVAITINAT